MKKIKKFLSSLYNNLALIRLKEFFENDSNNLISERGYIVLSNPDLMKKVNLAILEYLKDKKTGPIVIDFNKEKITHYNDK